jgi:uroporphyrinogen decarboxylase
MNARKKESGGLKPKDRVLRAIALKEPDMVPMYVTITPELAEKVARTMGIESYTLADSPLSQNRISFHEILTELGNDVVGIGACSPEADPVQNLGGGYTSDEWKIKFRKVGYYTEQVEYPMADAETVADIARFPFPEPLEKGRFDLARRVAEQYGEQYAICGDLECTIFEASWHLTGLEKLLMDLTMEKDYVFELMNRVQEYSVGVGKELIGMGADILWLGDDMGTQRGMLISPEMWRKYFKERMRRIIESLKAESIEVKVAYHCCGSYFPIIPDLIEIGIDILNALQPTAKDMEVGRLKELFGERVTLFGGMDVQDVLPFGTMDDVEREVRRVITAAGAGGGLLLAGSHNLQLDVSVEKLFRIFEIARKDGVYPLSG